MTAANKHSFNAIGMGDLYITVPNGDKPNTRILLKDVLYTLLMGVTLISVSRITIAGSALLFQNMTCLIYTKDKSRVGQIEMKNGLYHIFTPRPETAASATTPQAPPKIVSIDKLHCRLGHVAHDAAHSLIEKGLVHGLQLDETSKATVCESCEWAKHSQKPIQKVREHKRPAKIGDEIHSDLWGPSPVKTIGRRVYYISFTDGYFCHTTMYLLCMKSDALEAYRTFEALL